MTEPRLMSGADAATYCGVTPATFSQWVAAGRLPSPLPGTRRWDRKAIDQALDKLSGIVAPPIAQEDDFETEYDKWKRKYEARKAAERASPASVRLKKDGTPAKRPGPRPLCRD